MSDAPDQAAPPVAGAVGVAEWRRLRRDSIAMFESMRSLGDVISFNYGPRQSFVVLHPDHVKEVLVTNHRKFGLVDFWEEGKRLLGNGLLTSDGEFHKRQRRMSNPAFHHGRIVSYVDIITQYAKRVSDRWQPGAEADVHREMNELTLAVVGKTLFDTDIEGPDASAFREALNALLATTRLGSPIASMLRKLPVNTRKVDEGRATMDALIYRMIDERRRSGVDRGDLLSMLLLVQDEEGDGGGMTDEQIRDEAMTLVVAGHETTANALSWTWYLLSQNPDAEAKLHAELGDVLGGRLPTMEDLPSLSYTRKVLNESLRLYPPAWVLARKALEDYELGGYTIPAGSNVTMFPYLVHRDPRWWPEPDRFNPDRWGKDSEGQRGRFVYFPFGAGPRMCIGEQFAWMEATLVVAVLAQRWRPRLMEGHVVVPEPRLNLRPRGGVPMILDTRD